MISLGKLPTRVNLEIKKENVDYCTLNIPDFEYLYKLARLAGEEELISEKYFTKDGKNISYFNFIKGANPEMVAEAFSFGLVKFIYPSQNLIELSLFPKEIYKAIKNFKSKVLKSDKDIFLKILSSIPIWDDKGITYAPQHLIQIGISNGDQYSPSKPMPCSLEKTDLVSLGLQKLEDFLSRVFNFTKDDNIFVNKEDQHHLVYSKSSKRLSEQDEQKILAFQQRFHKGCYFLHHDKRVCPTVRKRTAQPCDICGPEESAPSTKKEDAPPAEKAEKMTTMC